MTGRDIDDFTVSWESASKRNGHSVSASDVRAVHGLQMYVWFGAVARVSAMPNYIAEADELIRLNGDTVLLEMA